MYTIVRFSFWSKGWISVKVVPKSYQREGQPRKTKTIGEDSSKTNLNPNPNPNASPKPNGQH